MNRTIKISLVLVVFGATARLAASAQDSLPDAVLRAFKDATVFVKAGYSGRLATGSGFLIMKSGENGYLATNAHVINAPHVNNVPITVVFKSGQKGEISTSATLVGKDDDRDIAILKVKLPNLPVPVNIQSKVKLRETMPVYVIGFPFGGALALNEGNPAVTISKGSVSSIRTDKDGKVGYVQIDGSVNPGNSGGPILDSFGGLVGIAVAKVIGTQIGIAIPAQELDDMLKGRISQVSFDEVENVKGKVTYKVTVELIDPLNLVHGVSLAVVPKSALPATFKAEKDKDGNFPALPTANRGRTISLKIAESGARGELVISGDPKKNETYMFQPSLIAGDGKLRRLQPGDMEVLFSKGGAGTPDTGSWLGESSQKPAADGKTSTRPLPEQPAKDDWLGSANKAPDIKAFEPLETGTTLGGEQRTVVDASVREIKIPVTVKDLVWSQDGKFLYALQNNGTLHKVSIPDLKEERQVSLSRECACLATSREGLLVLCNALQELYIFDEATLKPKKRIPAAGARFVAATPALSIAFLSDDRSLTIADLSAGRVVKTIGAFQMQEEQGKKIKKHKEGVTLSDFAMPTVTPDGKYLFSVGFECLHRFRINGVSLVYEEMGPRIGQNPQRIEISPDSLYVALPSGGGNSPVSDHPKAPPYSTYVYRVGNIGMPVVTVPSGSYPRALAFDKTRGKLYSGNYDTTLITFDLQGNKEKGYAIAERGNDLRQILPHPSGGRLVIRTEKGNLFWVELPK